jgi:gamma-glutamyltranspeptidase/glutathione hydrolase
MQFSFPYATLRPPVFADACVATTQPLAAQAGRDILARGGNAVDAALATAITLSVVEPTMNGIGADLFALVHDGATLHGLNASGPAARAIDVERLTRAGAMPLTGWDTVTVPGAVAGWAALSRRFGRLPFGDLFETAIRRARDGFLVPFVIARQWENQAPWFRDLPGYAECFLPEGRAPRAGERFRHTAAAATLAEIAATHGESFYRGRLAATIDAFARATGGALSADDLAAYEPEWVEPLAMRYRGGIVHELPPNGQGIAALIALGVLGHHGLDKLPLDDPRAWHLLIEAVRLGLSDLHAHVTDPRQMRTGAAELLDPARLARLAASIDTARSSGLAPKPSRAQGTVYLAAADTDGMMVSLIQSNYRGFGSGLVVPGTGIALHNRGACFTAEAGHPNAPAPGKRPMNTIIPGFLSDSAGRPLAAFGVMGGAIQAQAHVQVAHRLLDHDLQPQAALDAPRFRLADDGAVLLEETAPEALRQALAARGHVLKPIGAWASESGAGQVIMRHGDGYVAATDSRRDGMVAVL